MHYYLKEIVLDGKPEENQQWDRYNFQPSQEGVEKTLQSFED